MVLVKQFSSANDLLIDGTDRVTDLISSICQKRRISNCFFLFSTKTTQHFVETLTTTRCARLDAHWFGRTGGVLTDLLVMLLGFETDDLQDARAGDVRHDIRHTLPHAQQSPAQHVVLPEAHALQTLLALLNFFTLPSPKKQTR